MPIKIKLIILALFSLIATFTVGFIFFQNISAIGKELEKEGIADEVQKNVFERQILRDDYILHLDERPIIQLQIVSTILNNLLIHASKVFISADEQKSVARDLQHRRHYL